MPLSAEPSAPAAKLESRKDLLKRLNYPNVPQGWPWEQTVDEQGHIQIPDRGRPFFDPQELEGVPPTEEGAHDVFEKRDVFGDEVLEAAVGQFVRYEQIEGYQLRVPHHLVDPNPNQPRKLFKQDELLELAENIATHGQGTAAEVALYRTPEGEFRFALIAGERRWKAHSLIQSPHLVVVIVPALNQESLQDYAEIENFHRQDHTDMELAFIFERWRRKALQQGITTDTGQIKFIRSNVSFKHKFIERHLELIPLEKFVQELVHLDIIRMSQAFMIRDVAAARGVSETSLACKALKIQHPGQIDQLKDQGSWGRITPAHLHEAARILITGETREVDPVRVEIRSTIGKLLEAMGSVSLHGSRLIEQRAQHPDVADDVIAHLHGTPIPKLREILGALGAQIDTIESVVETLEEPIIEAPVREGATLLSLVEAAKEQLLSAPRADRLATAQRRFWIMQEVAKAGDARNIMPTGFELAHILNELHRPDPLFTSHSVANALQTIGSSHAATIGLSLDRDERHMRGPSDDFDWFTTYRLLTPEQQTIVNGIRAAKEANRFGSPEDGEDLQNNKVELTPSMELPREARATVIKHITPLILKQLGFRSTRYEQEFLSYLLHTGEGLERSSLDFYEFKKYSNVADRTKASQGLRAPQQRFSDSGLIKLVLGGHRVPRKFTLKRGAIPTLSSDDFERALGKAAIEIVEEAGPQLSAETVMDYFATWVNKPVLELLSALSNEVTLSTSLVDSKPPTMPALEQLEKNKWPAEIVEAALDEFISASLLQLRIRRTHYNQIFTRFLLLHGENKPFRTSDFYDWSGAKTRSQRVLAAQGLSSPLRSFSALGIIEVEGSQNRKIQLKPDQWPSLERTKREALLRRLLKSIRDYFEPPFTAETFQELFEAHDSIPAFFAALISGSTGIEPDDNDNDNEDAPPQGDTDQAEGTTIESPPPTIPGVSEATSAAALEVVEDLGSIPSIPLNGSLQLSLPGKGTVIPRATVLKLDKVIASVPTLSLELIGENGHGEPEIVYIINESNGDIEGESLSSLFDLLQGEPLITHLENEEGHIELFTIPKSKPRPTKAASILEIEEEVEGFLAETAQAVSAVIPATPPTQALASPPDNGMHSAVVERTLTPGQEAQIRAGILRQQDRRHRRGGVAPARPMQPAYRPAHHRSARRPRPVRKPGQKAPRKSFSPSALPDLGAGWDANYEQALNFLGSTEQQNHPFLKLVSSQGGKVQFLTPASCGGYPKLVGRPLFIMEKPAGYPTRKEKKRSAEENRYRQFAETFFGFPDGFVPTQVTLAFTPGETKVLPAVLNNVGPGDFHNPLE